MGRVSPSQPTGGLGNVVSSPSGARSPGRKRFSVKFFSEGHKTHLVSGGMDFNEFLNFILRGISYFSVH